MKTRTKIWLTIAASLVLLGCILFAVVMTTLKWDFMELATVHYETNTYETSETFDSISVNTDTADIMFMFSDDGKCRVECYEEEKAKHSVTVENNTLTVALIDEKSLHDFISYIGFNFDAPKITVYLPKNAYTSLFIRESTGDIEIPKEFMFQSIDITASTGDIKNYASVSENIKIITDTGDIFTENISAKNLSFSVSTGKINAVSVICEETFEINVSTGKTKLSNISCKNLISKGSTGDISMINLLAAERISIERDTGDILFDGCDANELFVKTSSGDVQGTFLSDKTFFVESNTGTMDVPKNTVGGKCEISTDTGDIKINIK